MHAACTMGMLTKKDWIIYDMGIFDLAQIRVAIACLPLSLIYYAYAYV